MVSTDGEQNLQFDQHISQNFNRELEEIQQL